MKKIEKPEEYEICRFDGICVATVYVGSYSNLKPLSDKLSWREDEERGELCYKPFQVLTLSEIVEKATNIYGGKCPMLTIFVESPLSGYILQYGNYGDEWWQTGDLDGYA